MVSLPSHIWNQVRNFTYTDLLAALTRDGWVRHPRKSSPPVYKSSDSSRRVSLHFHPHKSIGRKTLKKILQDIGWTTEEDLRRVGLVK